MGRPSTVILLPADIRADLDKRLAEGRCTLDDLVAALEGQGYQVSRSALGRYSKQFNQVAAKLRESREVAAAFARELGAVPNDDMGQMITELVHTLAFKASLARSDQEADDIDARDVAMLARALKDLSSSKQISARLALEIRAEEKKRVEAELKAKLTEAEDRGGVSVEAAREARRILGFDSKGGDDD